MIPVNQKPYGKPAFRRVWCCREQLAGQGQFPASEPVYPQDSRIEIPSNHYPDSKPARVNPVCFIRNSPNCLHPATPLSWWQQVNSESNTRPLASPDRNPDLMNKYLRLSLAFSLSWRRHLYSTRHLWAWCTG